MEEGAAVRNLGNAYGDPEVLNSHGLGHSLVLFWTESERDYYYGYTIDPNKYYIIGCDEDQRRQLLLYKSNFVGFPNRFCSDTPKGVIERVLKNHSPEMSPNILHYSEDEYPHRDFAFSCGIRSSFCFPFSASGMRYVGVMEIVSTCNQDVVTLKKFCQSFQGFNWSLSWSLSFPNIINVKGYANKEFDHFLEVVSQIFQLPLTQCWRYLHGIPCLVHQFSHRDFENLAPWCHFKDTCFHTGLGRHEAPLGSSCKNSAAFFCRNIKELSISQYPFAHYAQNCGSISCFTIFLGSYGLPGKDWALELFLPAQEMDNYYPQTLLNSIWAKMKECLPNCKLASGEQLGQVLSVKVISSSTLNEPEFFKLGQHDSSCPHHEGSEYTPTLNLFINGTEHRSNSNSYEEAATGITSKRLPHQVTEITLDVLEEESHIKHIEPHSLVCQPKRPVDILEYEGNTVERDHSALGMTLEEPSKLKNHTVTAERVENVVEVSPEKGIEYAATPESKRLKKSLIPCTLENISKQFGRPLKDAAESFSDELVEVSRDEDLEYAKTTASKRLEIPNTSFTLENIRKHFGRPQKDAAESFGVSLSTFKRKCRIVGITRWQPGKRKLIDNETGQRNFSSGMPNVQDTPAVAPTGQELNNMDVKVMYNGVPIRFEIPTSSGITELENNVIERLPLKRKSFSIKYQDDEGDWVLVACDKDVEKCFEISRSLKKAAIKMLLDPLVT